MAVCAGDFSDGIRPMEERSDDRMILTNCILYGKEQKRCG